MTDSDFKHTRLAIHYEGSVYSQATFEGLPTGTDIDSPPTTGSHYTALIHTLHILPYTILFYTVWQSDHICEIDPTNYIEYNRPDIETNNIAR